DQLGNAVAGVKALVRISLARLVRVGGDLPARDVDSLQPRFDHLDRLRARERPVGGQKIPVPQALPKLSGPELGKRVRDLNGGPEPDDIARLVGALDSGPARARFPFRGEVVGIHAATPVAKASKG